MSDAPRSEPEAEPLELDRDALAMLRAYRAEERIPAELQRRVWSRVRADVEPSPTRWLRYGAVVGLLAAAAVGVLWAGGQLLRAEPRAPASQAGYERDGTTPAGVVEAGASERALRRGSASGEPHGEPAPSPAAGGAAPAGPSSGSAAATDEPARAAAPTKLDATSPRSSGARGGADDGERRTAPVEPAPVEPAPVEPAPVEPAPGRTLAEENRLLAQARAALIDGDPEQALARLGEHARRFPEGVLSEERQALRAVALCEAGRDADGEAAARAFLRAHPHAALAERVRGACLE